MRSTRGRTRASIKRAQLPFKGLVTDAAHITAPLHSNAETHDPGNALPAVRNAQWGPDNTNLQLSRGGRSCFPRMREGHGYGK